MYYDRLNSDFWNVFLSSKLFFKKGKKVVAIQISFFSAKAVELAHFSQICAQGDNQKDPRAHNHLQATDSS